MRKFLVLIGLLMVAGAAQAQTTPQALLTWTAPTTNTDGSTLVGALTYNVYQYSNAVWSKVGVTAAGITTYTVVGLAAGNTYNFHITAVNAAGQESGASNQVTKIIPPAPPPVLVPNPPTNAKAQ